MKGTYTSLNHIRRQVFEEVARLAYSGDELGKFDELPYKIIQGEYGTYRDSVFLERAIVAERIRLAVGLSPHRANENKPLSLGLKDAAKPERYYEPPLINVIKFACNACPDNVIHVTDACQGCLGHPCQEVCPKKAISVYDHKSHIDQDLCIKCGRCLNECPYGAIVRQERPCSKACGMNAIGSDEHGRADIDYEKCVSCGQCLVNCPFGAIADKSQIYQVIQAIKSDTPVYAIVAPAIAGQFGPKCTPDKLRPLFRELGFADVHQVSVGADLCTIQEAGEFLKHVPDDQPYMGTSCCPSWSSMVKKLFPKESGNISMALTPMVFTGRLVKKWLAENDGVKNARVCFIGPCSAKKLEASRTSIRSEVDFVLTFEELAGMAAAKDIDYAKLPSEPWDSRASGFAEGFAQSGGVAAAVVEYAKEMDPDREIKTVSAEGLDECRKMIQAAKAGKYNGCLLEGMACPGGCIAGAGTLIPVAKAKGALNKVIKEAPIDLVSQTEFSKFRESLETVPDEEGSFE